MFQKASDHSKDFSAHFKEYSISGRLRDTQILVPTGAFHGIEEYCVVQPALEASFDRKLAGV
jgi:hypothetical protein